MYCSKDNTITHFIRHLTILKTYYQIQLCFMTKLTLVISVVLLKFKCANDMLLTLA